MTASHLDRKVISCLVTCEKSEPGFTLGWGRDTISMTPGQGESWIKRPSIQIISITMVVALGNSIINSRAIWLPSSSVSPPFLLRVLHLIDPYDLTFLFHHTRHASSTLASRSQNSKPTP